MWTHKNIKGKYWVVSQQALIFNAFLARHDDFNDAHIKIIIETQESIMKHMTSTFKSNPLPMHSDFVIKQLMGKRIN